MLSGIPMNNHKWMIHVCSSTIVNCANYLSPKTKQPIIKIKSLCHNPYFQNMVLILYAHSLPLCIAKSNVIPHHKVNGQYSWMNEYVLHFVYGDLKLHCDLEFFVAILLFCFHPKFIIYPDGIFTYKTLKGPASACMVEATHIKREADVNLVAFSCVLCDVRIYTVTVCYRSLNMNWIPEKAVWDSWLNNIYM
jgi:hypothetical protein